MLTIKEQLKTIDAILKGDNATCLQHLQEGIELTTVECPKEFPDMAKSSLLRELFSWHNGTSMNNSEPAVNFRFTPDFAMLSLEEIRNLLDVDQDYLFTARRQLPLFLSGHGEYLTIAYDDLMFNPDKAKLYYVSTWNPELELYTEIYDSLPRFLETVITCFDKGAYYFEEGIVEIDFDLERKIGKKLNKAAKEYWNRS